MVMTLFHTGQAIRAFDCENPSISDQISLVDTEKCMEATPTLIIQQTKMYHVYQQAVTKQVMVTESRLQTAELTLYCGIYSHVSLMDAKLTPTDASVSL